MEWLLYLRKKQFLRGEEYLRIFGSNANQTDQIKMLIPDDWESLVIYAHGLPFYKNLHTSNLPLTLYRVYEKLLPHAYALMDSLGEGDFLYELALTHESNELEPLLPLAFKELRLPPLYPLGLAFHLLWYINLLVPDSTLNLAYEVDQFLIWQEPKNLSLSAPLPQIHPCFPELRSAARMSWDHYDNEEKVQAQIKFDALLANLRNVYTDYAKANNYLLPPQPKSSNS